MRYFEFVTYAVINVTGKDARRYLNARLTCNVKDLAANNFSFGAQLTAQGKCQGTFSLINLDDSKFILVSSYAPLQQILSNFRQFIVADRVDTVDSTSEYKHIHLVLDESESKEIVKLLDLPAFPTSSAIQSSANGIIAWANNRGFNLGLDLLIPVNLFDDFLKKISDKSQEKLSDDQMLIGRAKANSAQFSVDIDNLIFSEAHVPDYVSFTKGCYVGQEVIERIDAMGKTAWKIIPFKSQHFIAAKSQLNDNFGSIINCSTGKIDGAHWGFARVKNAANLESKLSSTEGIEIEICDLK